MSECKHIARPYAKAVFEVAKESHSLQSWSDLLNNLSLISNDELVVDLVNSPSTSSNRLAEIIFDILSDTSDLQKNYINLLILNDRLLASSEIFALFEEFKRIEENTTYVTIESADEVDDTFKQQVKDKLQQKFGGQISIELKLDPDLIGGAVIRSNNFIIDGSVKGKIERLKLNLLA
ncbi:F0F1 ATP synthase subunit delta [Francisellaceae bacterium]|nr:F0F1 ATP synthase subunit delta [Francisellaceae bacterium]